MDVQNMCFLQFWGDTGGYIIQPQKQKQNMKEVLK